MGNLKRSIRDSDGNVFLQNAIKADVEPLVGIFLMEGYQLTVQVFQGGLVELRKVNTV